MAVKKKNHPKENSGPLLNDLAQLENYVRAFWEFLPLPICYVNPAFNIIDVSRALEEFSGFKAVDLISKRLGKFFCDRGKFRNMEKKLLGKEVLRGEEAVFCTKTGEGVSVEVSAAPWKDTEGKVIGYFFAFSDITERKKFEQELQDKIEDLERFQKLTVGRELKMAELKKEIERLKGREQIT